ncbi:lysophospholipid acyltransferase 6-like [Halichondria panicea]|uniref:lysophospholipid acyltransferase 6-like n=1 Tax=Halichondria panicea TaxID=6063 RepID=UPI00312BA2DE
MMFQAAAEVIGFPVDQTRYITLLLLSYPLAYVFRYALHPSHTSLITRHIFSLSFGLLFGFLCFGSQMIVLFAIIGVCYAMLQYLPATVVQRYTMVWAMGSMSAAHIYRMMTDYGGWSLDFTGPLMIIVQKVTLVAFALHDGKGRSDSSLNQDQREQKIDVCPSPLEYFTYIFNFHSFLAGPSFSIKDFLAFMDGSNLKFLNNPNQFAKAKEHVREPSAVFAVVSKLVYSLVSMVGFTILASRYTEEMAIDPQYSIFVRTYIITFAVLKHRLKYYFVWYMADSINNLCGLGFSGYDEKGQPKWDITTNAFPTNVELASNPRDIFANWNICSAIWLRRVCYERVPFSPTIATFALSAWWHGFYPGYYLCGLFFGFTSEAARKMRRLVRPHFQSSLLLKWSYDVITMLLTRLYMDYTIASFILMYIGSGMLFWSYFYFIPNIIIFVIVFLFPSGKSKEGRESKETRRPKAD